ncbi:MAG: tetratricopeptide repeat protein [Myxococcaceae bacterium]
MSVIVDLTAARQALEAGRVEDALMHAEQALKAVPEDPAALALKAELLLRLERWEPGLGACDRLLALTPNDAWAHRLRCVALENLGRYDEQIAAARDVLKLEPQNANGYFLLGKAMMHQGNDPQARAALEEAVRFEPEVALYRLTLARLLFDSTPAIAEALLQRIVTDEPNRAAELNDLGVLVERKGEVDAATKLYQRALAADPALAAPKNNLARLKAIGSAGIHYTALAVFFLILAGVPFAIGAGLYHFGHDLFAGAAFTLATFLAVAAVIVSVRQTKKRSAAKLQPPECSVR